MVPLQTPGQLFGRHQKNGWPFLPSDTYLSSIIVMAFTGHIAGLTSPGQSSMYLIEIHRRYNQPRHPWVVPYEITWYPQETWMVSPVLISPSGIYLESIEMLLASPAQSGPSGSYLPSIDYMVEIPRLDRLFITKTDMHPFPIQKDLFQKNISN